jgi:hypothetical protein
VSDFAGENALHRAAQLREKAAAAEQRASSALSPVERALYQAESVNYQALALEVEKLGRTAQRIDATTASVIEKTPSLVTREKQTPNHREAPTDELAALDAEPRSTTRAESSDDESLPLLEKLDHTADATTASVTEETASLVSKKKQPPTYWYVGHTDAPFDFFRGQEKITEEEWRREAPADVVAALDAEGSLTAVVGERSS